MSFRNWNLEWLNLNAQRAYPLTADATAADDTVSFTLPTDFIVAIYLRVHSGLNVQPGRFFVKSIGSYSAGYNVEIGYAADSGNITVATALIARSTHTKNKSYELGGVGIFADTIGRIAIGSLDNVDLQPAGQFEFSLAGGRLEPDAIRPMIRGVSSIQAQNGNSLSEKLYGTVVIEAGKNMQITAIPADEDGPARLIFDAIEGRGLTSECACSDEADAVPITTINGIAPTADGNFQLLGDDCLLLSEIEHGLQLTDECSEPCCGCPELAAVTTIATELQTQANSLSTFLTGLEGRMASMSLVLGSL